MIWVYIEIECGPWVSVCGASWLAVSCDVARLGSGAIAHRAIHLIPSQFFLYFLYFFTFTFLLLFIFYIEWLRFKVAFCNFKSQPPLPITSGAIPRVLHLISIQCGYGLCAVPVCQCAILSLLSTMWAVAMCRLKNKFETIIQRAFLIFCILRYNGAFNVFYWH